MIAGGKTAEVGRQWGHAKDGQGKSCGRQGTLSTMVGSGVSVVRAAAVTR